MARTSAALKSIIFGVSTQEDDFRDPNYLKEQINMQTVEDSGLHKRPPTELISAGFANIVNDATYNTIVKSFKIGTQTFWLTIKNTTANPAANKSIVIYDALGVAQTSTIDSIGYFSGITKKEDLDIDTQHDTVFILNKTTAPQLTPLLRQATNTSMIKVQRAAAENELLQVRFKDNNNATLNIQLTATGLTLTNRGTNAVAAQLHALIAGSTAVGITTQVRGSIITISRTDLQSAQIETEDESAGNTLLAINGEIQNTTQLPRYTVDTQILTVKPEKNSTNGTFYLQAKPITTQGTPVVPPAPNTVITAGRIDLAPATTLTGLITSSGTAGSNTPQATIAGKPLTECYFDFNTNTNTTQLKIRTAGGISGGDMNSVTLIWDRTGTPLYEGSVVFDATSTSYGITLPNTTIIVPNGDTISLYIDQVFNLNTTMYETTWEETSAINQQYQLDSTTMPQTITNPTQGTVNITNTAWDEKGAGDEKTNPTPNFIGKNITALAIFQNRLLAIQNGTLETTETDNTRSWWRNTVTQLLSTHPVRMRSTANEADNFHTMLNHNKDLMIMNSKAQFKLTGDVALTPQTSGMPETTQYTNNPEVLPVSIGKNVFFSFNYGTFAGIAKFKTSERRQDRADPITDHVNTYMPGKPNTILGDANLGILYVVFDSDIYTCNYNPREKERLQDNRWAWSHWKSFRGTTTPTIADARIEQNKLQLMLTTGTNSELVQLDIKQDPTAATVQTYLDIQNTVTATAGTFTIPTTYPFSDPNFTIVYAQGEPNAGDIATYTETAGTFTLTSAFQPTTKLAYGLTYKTQLQPHKPIIRDSAGKVNPYTTLTVVRWLVSLKNSADVYAKIISDYYTIADQYWSGLISSDIKTTTDQVANNSGTFGIGFKQNPNYADLEIYSQGHLPLHIKAINWLGTYTSRGKRF